MSPDTVSRLHRLRLESYRNIKTCNLFLGPLMLLVGPNGSKKPNVLDALRFTNRALGEDLGNAPKEHSGITEVQCRSAGYPTHFTATMTFVADTGRQVGEYRSGIGTTEDSKYRASREVCHIHSGEFGSKDRFFEARTGRLISGSEERPPRIFLDRLLLVALSRQEPFRQPFDGLASIGVFSPAPGAARVTQKPNPDNLLRRDASNIMSVIERLRRTDLPAKVRIGEYLSHIVPGVRTIQHVSAASWETLKFQQEVQKATSPQPFQVSLISDRTLRALGVLVVLSVGAGEVMNPARIEGPRSTPRSATSGLFLDTACDASQRRQILATSHSPDPLDSLSITIDELLAMRPVSGTTVVDWPNAATQIALKGSLFTASESAYTNQLQPEVGGVAW